MISLSQICDMNQDKVMAAKWLSEHVDEVLTDLAHLHNMRMSMAIMHSILTHRRSEGKNRNIEDSWVPTMRHDDECDDLRQRVERVVKILLENADV